MVTLIAIFTYDFYNMVLVRKKTKQTYFQDRVITKAPGTREGIKHALNNFENFCSHRLRKDMEQIIKDLLKLKPDKREDTVFDLLQQWISWNSSKINPSTIRVYCSGITRYLNYRGIKLTQQEIKENLDRPRKIFDEKTPLTREILHHIFKASGYPKVALYLALLSSGMRIGEAVSIRKENLQFVYSKKGKMRVMVKILAKFSKNGIGRSVFISKESYRHVENKLKRLKDNQLVWGVNEDRKKATAAEEKAFSRCLERIGMDERFETTGRHKISLHSLRAYFFTRAAKIDPNFAQLMLGHSGYLMREYDQRTYEDKLETYLKVEPELIIDNTEFLIAQKKKLEKENSLAKKVVIQIGSRQRRTDAKVERFLKGMAEINPEYGKILDIRKDGPY